MILQEMAHEKVTEKGVADYVTNVDVAVQNYLKEALGKEFPDIALIAEEKENLGLNSRKSYWILDPIDGTTNLIRDYHLSAVSLGLYENGKITFGVVYNPFTEELFYGAKGEGAYLNGTPIHASDQPEFKDAVVSFGSSPYEKNRAKELFPICLLYTSSASRVLARILDSFVFSCIALYIGETIFSNFSNVFSLGIYSCIALRILVVMLGTAEPAFSETRSLLFTKWYTNFAILGRSISV